MSDYINTRDFLIALDEFPELPTNKHGEWVHTVRSRWIDGIFYRDREDPNLIVELCRIGNNQPQYGEAVIDYEVRIPFEGGQLTMSPDAALYLGRHLIEIGAFGVRDRGRNAWFLTGQPDRQ